MDRPLLLGAHLEELRKRILWVLLSVLFFSGVSFYFVNDLIRMLKWPAAGQIDTLAVFSPTAAILAYMKVALTAGLVCALPLCLYEAWMFISPALGLRHIRNGVLFIFSGTLCFIVGAAFNFFVLIPASVKFLLSLGRGELQYVISLESYISFVLSLLLAGGLVFEMPILAFVLSKYAILTSTKMIGGWRIAAVFILVAAAVLTPTPDAVNMLLLSLPMFFLYLVCIGVALFAEKNRTISQSLKSKHESS